LKSICARVVGIPTVAATPNVCDARRDLVDLATATGARVRPSVWDFGTRPAGCSATQCCSGINGIGVSPDADGLCPLVSAVASTGSGLGTHIVSNVQLLTTFAQFNVIRETVGANTDVDGNALPLGSTSDFITAVTPASATLPTSTISIPAPTFDTTTFFGVTPGTTLTYNVSAFNGNIVATGQPQVFRAVIRVQADACLVLDEREVFIVVPPTPLTEG
jgi:hypothetical protein